MSDVETKLKRSLARIETKGRALKRSLSEIRTPEYMQKLGEFVAEKIRIRTRLGFGVENEDAEKKRMEGLKDSTISARERLRARGELHPQTTAKRSNLTATGQLLDSIKPKKVTPRTVTVGPTGQRRGESLTNQKVAEGLFAQGRKFATLSRDEKSAVANRIRADMKAFLRKALK